MDTKIDLTKVREAMEYVILQSGCDYNNEDNENAAIRHFNAVVDAIESGSTIPEPPAQITIQPF